ncbi:MAG: hypothetical protein ACYDDO_01325 [Acidiferrobacterales bacterium]
MDPVAKEDPFYAAFRGSFSGVLSWKDLDTFWGVVRSNANAGWYIYAVGELPPTAPSTAEQVNTFVAEIDALLRHEHQEDYCGIVYVDDAAVPSLIKIFDPNNLGVQCGFSDSPPLPGWIMTRLPPCDLKESRLPGNRRRWWHRLWA